MDKEAFVRAIRLRVEDAAATGMVAELTRPPGRRPRERDKRLAAWFNKLPTSDRENVEAVIGRTANAAVFHFLCVLDGVAAIEDFPKGRLELLYRKGQRSIPLNDENGDYLHDMMPNAR